MCLCVHTHIYIHTPNNFTPCQSLAPSFHTPPKSAYPVKSPAHYLFFKNNYSSSYFKYNSSSVYYYYFWEDLFVRSSLLHTGSETHLVYFLFTQLPLSLNDIKFNSISSKVPRILFLRSPIAD